MNEAWRPVVGYEGVYSVSNLGRVRRELPTSNTQQGKFLRQHKRNGYPSVSLCVNGIPRTFVVHRLVASSFLGLPNARQVANHKNGLKTDNRVENLEWVTSSRNIKHAYDTGLTVGLSAERNGKAKLTFLQAQDIRSRHTLGNVGVNQLASEYKLTVSAIRNILAGRRYAHPPQLPSAPR